MTAALSIAPTSPPVRTTPTVTATGGGAYKNRLLLNGVAVFGDCSDTGFTAGVTMPSTVGSQSLEWDQLIAGVWTSVATLSFSTVAASSTSSPITITADDTVIEDLTFSAPTSNGPNGARTIFISALGTAASPIDGIIIRRCTFNGGTIGIWLRQVTNFTIEDCVVNDADYAGIDVWSGIHGVIQRNSVNRIGASRTDMSDPAFGNNAYGIIANRNESSSLVTDPVSEDILIDSNTIDNVPLWMGMNTHGGKDLTFSNNRVTRAPRAVFCAGSPTGAGTTQCVHIEITDNTLLQSTSKPGGSSDKTAIKLLSATGANLVTGNTIGTSYTSDDVDSTGSSGTFTPNTVVAG